MGLNVCDAGAAFPLRQRDWQHTVNAALRHQMGGFVHANVDDWRAGVAGADMGRLAAAGAEVARHLSIRSKLAR